MKRIPVIIFCLVTSLTTFGQAPVFDWVAQIGGTGSEWGRSIATDQAGNIFVSGTFSDTVDFDPDPSIYYPLISEGSFDVFVAKFTSGGDLVWAHSFGDFISDSSDGIVVDTFGNVLISGFYGGTVDFDPGADTLYLTAEPANAAFILKLDNNGNLIWVKDFIGGFHDQDITTDKAGNIFVTGSFSGNDDFDPGPDAFTLSASGSFDVFVLKLDSDGGFVWAKGMGGEESDRGYSIALDTANNVYVTGKFELIADFDPGPDTYNLSTGGIEDDKGMFITKLDSEGNFEWAKKVGDCDSDIIGYGIAVDDLGNSYTTGVLRGEADFDPGPNVNILNSEDSRAFVMKLNSTGNYCWVKAIQGEGKSTARDVALDKYNNVYTIGYFEETIDLNAGPDTFNLNAISWDTYILKLESTGNFSWAGSFYGGTSLPAGGPSITIDPRGDIYSTGSFIITNDFDPGDNNFELTSFGAADTYVHKMNQSCFADPSISTFNEIICQGDSLELLAGIDNWASVNSYLWSTGDTTNMTVVSPDTSSTFMVTLNYTDDTASCAATGVIDIVVLPTSDTTFQELISCDSINTGQTVWAYLSTNGCDSIIVSNVSWLPLPTTPEAPAEIVILSDISTFEINIPPVPTATIYEWTIPLDVQILSGEGTNEIVLDWSALNIGGTVCVSAMNECGSSTLSCTEIILDITDAISESDRNKKTSAIIFPNPVDQTLQVLFENAVHRKLRLISAQGKVVFQKDCFNEKLFINTADFPAGVYSLGIQHIAEKYGYWRKIVVLR